jgi:hypothetical protein
MAGYVFEQAHFLIRATRRVMARPSMYPDKTLDRAIQYPAIGGRVIARSRHQAGR